MGKLKRKKTGTSEPITDHEHSAVYRVILLAGLMLVVCIVAAAAHWPALSAKAIQFDDEQYFIKNPLVQNPSWYSAGRFFSEVLEPSTVRGYYQPLSMVSLMVDYALGGSKDNLLPFHRTSMALHLANTAMVIILLYLLFGRLIIAAGVGLLFGVHPMTAESVCWVSDRKTLLAAFFVLSCLIFYVNYVRKNDRRFYAACLLMYILALLSKPTSIALPALILLMDFWPLKRLNLKCVYEKLPFFVIGGIFAIITVISQGRTSAVIYPVDYGLWRIPLTFCYNIIFYLHKMVWPVDMSSNYVFPSPFNLSNPMVLASVIGTIILIASLVISLRWTRAAITGWLFFFVAILPTMQILQFSEVIAANKFAYLPSTGLLMALAAFLCWIWGSRGNITFAMRRTVVVIAILILAVFEMAATHRFLAYWSDSVTLYEYMLTMSPNSAQLHCNMGSTYGRLNNIDKAIAHSSRALELRPGFAEPHNNLGAMYHRIGNYDKAIEHCSAAIVANPDFESAHYNLGQALWKKGRVDDAINSWQRTVQLNPKNYKAHNNLGVAYLQQNKFDKAVAHLMRTLKLNPNDAMAYSNLGQAATRQGKFDQAIEYYRRAVEIQPTAMDDRYKLAGLLDRQNRFDQAIAEFQKILQINPSDYKAYNNLAAIFYRLGKADLAIEYWRQALRLNPNDTFIQRNLQQALKQRNGSNNAIK